MVDAPLLVDLAGMNTEFMPGELYYARYKLKNQQIFTASPYLNQSLVCVHIFWNNL